MFWVKSKHKQLYWMCRMTEKVNGFDALLDWIWIVYLSEWVRTSNEPRSCSFLPFCVSFVWLLWIKWAHQSMVWVIVTYYCMTLPFLFPSLLTSGFVIHIYLYSFTFLVMLLKFRNALVYRSLWWSWFKGI